MCENTFRPATAPTECAMRTFWKTAWLLLLVVVANGCATVAEKSSVSAHSPLREPDASGTKIKGYFSTGATYRMK